MLIKVLIPTKENDTGDININEQIVVKISY